jgi:FkbM family methyltransferase
MNKLLKAGILISEGDNFSDKLIIFNYFLRGFINRITGKPINPRLSRGVTLKNKDGIFYCGNHINSVWVASTIHEENVNKYFSLSSGTFVDVGANIGKYTIKIARQLKDKGKAIAIEPEPSNFQVLKKNIVLNNLKNVNAFNLACSSHAGKSAFYLNDSGTGSHSLIKKTNKNISVNLCKLDSLLSSLKIKKVDFIKIDVEGAELDVIAGAKNTLKSFPKIIVEIENSESIKKLELILRKAGYQNFTRLSKEEYLIQKN